MADVESDRSSAFVGSSSIYTGQYITTFTQRNRWSTSNPDSSNECCLECCCGACICLGYIFCLSRMKRASRLKVLWVWLSCLAILGGFLGCFVFFGPVTQEVSSTDMRTVDKKVSSIFCDGITLVSDTDFSAYLLDTVPPIDTTKIQKFEKRETNYVRGGDYTYWKFYLLRGSVISALSCSDTPVDLVLLKGDTNFNKWTIHQSCAVCAIGTHVVNFQCDSSQMNNVTLTIHESNNYYFVYNNVQSDTWMTTDFHGRRTLYDVSTSTSTCLSGLQCVFDLEFISQQVIIYHMSDDDTDDDMTLTSKCNVNTWVFVVVFGAFPFVLGLFMSVILYNCCKDPEPGFNQIRPLRRPFVREPNERTPLSRDRPPLAVVREPPRYEDVIRNEAPPSYEQATGQG